MKMISSSATRWRMNTRGDSSAQRKRIKPDERPNNGSSPRELVKVDKNYIYVHMQVPKKGKRHYTRRRKKRSVRRRWTSRVRRQRTWRARGGMESNKPEPFNPREAASGPNPYTAHQLVQADKQRRLRDKEAKKSWSKRRRSYTPAPQLVDLGSSVDNAPLPLWQATAERRRQEQVAVRYLHQAKYNLNQASAADDEAEFAARADLVSEWKERLSNARARLEDARMEERIRGRVVGRRPQAVPIARPGPFTSAYNSLKLFARDRTRRR